MLIHHLPFEKVSMTSEDSELLQCYNKGCGNKFNPKDNKEDSCCFHPGNPVFHDSYKGWSCCNKRSVEFNDFLNFKGCKTSFHSNVKPPEPKKPVVDKSKANEVYEYVAPSSKVSTLVRPPFDTPLIKLQPEVAHTLKSQVEAIVKQPSIESDNEIQIGTSCKNSGCKTFYEGPDSLKTECIHHSGTPVFHEGFKYWSCCKKKTTDFAVFLEQIGCSKGEHVWVKKDNTTQANCRYDWHQTGSHVFLSIYAKKYDPEKSSIEVNPIRVKIHLEFLVDNSQFDKDFELCGVIDVENCGVSMLPMKVEIKLKKAEPGSWSLLNMPVSAKGDQGNEDDKKAIEVPAHDDEAVDLADIN